MAFVNSAFANEICNEYYAKNFVFTLHKNAVATTCVHIDRSYLLNEVMNCYKSSSLLTIDHMVKDGSVICIAVRRSNP